MIGNTNPSAGAQTSENLFINALPFKFPAEPVTFYFSDTDKPEIPLVRLLTDQLIPPVVRSLYPNLPKDKPVFTSFDRPVDGFTPLQIDFTDKDNYHLAKKYYNRAVINYFRGRGNLVQETFVHDTEVWVGNPELKKKSPDFLSCYDRFTIRVSYDFAHKTPMLIISYDRPARILNKSVKAMIDEYNAASADPFEQAGTNPVELFKKVLVTMRVGKNHRRKFTIRKYAHLMEDVENGETIDFNHVHPIMNTRLEAYLGMEEEEDNPFRRPESKYKKHCAKIDSFITHYLYVEEFLKVVPFERQYIHVEAGHVNPASKELVFAGGATNYVPRKGVNDGPFRGPSSSNIKLLFIGHQDRKEDAKSLLSHLRSGYGDYTGLETYLGCPFTVQTGVPFSTDHPFEEIRQKFEQLWPTIDHAASYIGIYMTPVSKHIKDAEKLKDYYRVKELFLKYGIPVQCIETDKMLQRLAEDERTHKKYFGYTLQNMSIAINAKLGGTPWRLNVPEKRELVIGVGAFRNRLDGTKYIGSAFSFDNTGSFNSFRHFRKDEIDELGGSIKMAVKAFSNTIQNPDRLIIHYYKDMNEREVQVIEEALGSLDLAVPIFIVTINKTESEDIFVFDEKSPEKMPFSGRYVNLGAYRYLLCNNTRYENNYGRVESYPFPVKLKIWSPNAPEDLDQNTIRQLIDQVYQFSRIYWKSVSQQNLPVTTKYPEMVAEIAPFFTGSHIPESADYHNLWFL
jgi:hypothetical protein